MLIDLNGEIKYSLQLDLKHYTLLHSSTIHFISLLLLST
jgi:hypothetical protein